MHFNRPLFIFLLSTFVFSGSGFSQAFLSYDIHRVYPPISMTKKQLKEAGTVSDLNEFYKTAWVKEYISVEVSTICQGKMRKAVSKDDTLSQEQKNIVQMADEGTEISVTVHYLPDNTLSHNDPKEVNFNVLIDPENDASFTGGQPQMEKYLKENLINKIPANVFRQHQLAAVKFTVDEKGRIADAHIFWSSENEKTDQLLLATVCNMPDWQPAVFANGQKAKQEFALTVGDMESCVVNLLNIRLN
ncbi:MAG: energy transducer TonB [Bacteroidota bacterium]